MATPGGLIMLSWSVNPRMTVTWIRVSPLRGYWEEQKLPIPRWGCPSWGPSVRCRYRNTADGEQGRRTCLCCRCQQTEISRCSKANFMPINFNVWELFSIFTKSVTNLQRKMEMDVCARTESRSLSLSHVASSFLSHICRLDILNRTQQSEMSLKRLCSSAWVILYYTNPNVKSVSSKSHEM